MYSILAYIIIPLYTLLFTAGYGWFQTNFSVIGNTIGRKGMFVLWGMLVAVYFVHTLKRITSLTDRKAKRRYLIPLALILLIFAVTTPYLPNELPLKSFLHIIFAFLAAVCLLLFLTLTTYALKKEDAAYGIYFYCCLYIAAVSAMLLLMIGIVSSALEIFFTFSTVALAEQLLRRLKAESTALQEQASTI